MSKQLGEIRKLRTKLLLILVVLLLAIVYLLPSLFQSLAARDSQNQHLQAIQTISKDIIYYDEVLTMSARMFAYTQAPTWETRYQTNAARLDEALASAQKLDPEINEAITATAKVNQALIEIESEAFEQAKLGHTQYAQSILINATYEDLKAQYAQGVFNAMKHAIKVEESAISKENEEKIRSYTFLLAMLLLFLLIFIVFFYRHNKTTDYYIGELLASLEKTIHQLQEKTEHLTQANHVKSQLLANMSHELRTPINGIYGSLQLLRQQPATKEDLDLIDTSIQCSELLVSLVNDILDFTHLEAGKLELDIKPFDLNKTLKTVEHIFREECRQNGLMLEFDAQLNDWQRKGDEIRIKQILFNLLNNAVKFTPEGRVSVRVSDNAENEMVNITIADTGIGMSEATMQKMFERFEQADASTTRSKGGTGLGMPIVKALLEEMSGAIDVKSQEGFGTQIDLHFLLPKHMQTDELNVQPNEVTFAPLTGLTALVAEDNTINQIVISKMLQKVGIDATLVANGQEAINKLTAEVDLVLLDIQMPIMDGTEACKAIKALRPSLPIIAVTANVFESDIMHYKAIGFDAVVSKPISQDDFVAALHSVSVQIDKSVGS
ncbi:ATP-binding protein [Pseudoalteromonas xiamenensis]